jgi:hypothetical protein
VLSGDRSGTPLTRAPMCVYLKLEHMYTTPIPTRQQPLMKPTNDKENKPLVQKHVDPSQTRQAPVHTLKVRPSLADDPMNAPTYLSSPLSTLNSSTNPTSQISIHDLLEAYNILTLRLKSLYPSISYSQDGEETINALEPLKTNAPVLVRALKRDVERAFVNPLLSAFAWSSPSHSATDLSPEYQDSIAQSQKHVELTEDDVQQARESALVCHYALRLISFLFRSQTLYQAFNGASHQVSTWLEHDSPSFPSTRSYSAPTYHSFHCLVGNSTTNSE